MEADRSVAAVGLAVAGVEEPSMMVDVLETAVPGAADELLVLTFVTVTSVVGEAETTTVLDLTTVVGSRTVVGSKTVLGTVTVSVLLAVLVTTVGIVTVSVLFTTLVTNVGTVTVLGSAVTVCGSAVTVIYLMTASCVCVTVSVTVTVAAAWEEGALPPPPVEVGLSVLLLVSPPVFPVDCVAGPGSRGTTEYVGAFWLTLTAAATAASAAASRAEL